MYMELMEKARKIIHLLIIFSSVFVFGFLVFVYVDIPIDTEENTEESIPPKDIEEKLLSEKQKEIILNTTTNLHNVVFINDGDTVIVDINGERVSVRMVGIDTPEVKTKYTRQECFGREASSKTFELLFGQEVGLELDESQGYFDKYDRLLVYIYLDDVNINAKLIKEGFAKEYTYNNNPYRYQEEFKEHQLKAKENNLGMWESGLCEK